MRIEHQQKAVVADLATAFVLAMLINFAVGCVLWLATRGQRRDLRPRDGYLLVTLAWIFMCAAGTIPLAIALPQMSLTDAVFETTSGLTTTGATVIVGIDELPMSILYYRQQLQWLGGMGIIVLAVAVLPMLGIGGMQLYRAETPGPVYASVPSSSHATPPKVLKAESASVMVAPPSRRTFFSLPSATNATHSPSGENVG